MKETINLWCKSCDRVFKKKSKRHKRCPNCGNVFTQETTDAERKSTYARLREANKEN